jgi:alanine-synthesizing transaminase
MCGNREYARDYVNGVKTLASMRLCSNVPAQTIIPAALKDPFATGGLYRPEGRIYEQREYIYNALNGIEGISVKKPDAAFYIFPKIDVKKFNIVNDEKFAYDLLREKHILIVHGSGFNWHLPDHFRLVYLPDIGRLRQATERLRDFLSGYRQKP